MSRVLINNAPPRRSIKFALFARAKSATDWSQAALTDPNLLIIMAFCGIGLFVALLVASLGEPS